MPENTSWKADVLNAELQATACPGAIDALIDNAILWQRNLTAVDGRKAIEAGRQVCEGRINTTMNNPEELVEKMVLIAAFIVAALSGYIAGHFVWKFW